MNQAAPMVYACPTCGAPLPPGSDRCARCGAVHGEHRRCYGCGGKTETIRKDGIVYVCAACGRPRVPMEQPGVPRSGREMEPLGRVAAARKDRGIATSLGIAALVVDAPVMFFGMIFALAGFGLLTALTFGFAAVLFVAAMFAFLVVSKKAATRANDAMRDAFGAVALDVMRAKGAITAPMLAAELGVPVDVAERALERLPARDDVRVETVVDDRADDGQVRYRVARDDLHAAAAVQEAGDAEQAAFDARLQAAIRAKERG